MTISPSLYSLPSDPVPTSHSPPVPNCKGCAAVPLPARTRRVALLPLRRGTPHFDAAAEAECPTEVVHQTRCTTRQPTCDCRTRLVQPRPISLSPIRWPGGATPSSSTKGTRSRLECLAMGSLPFRRWRAAVERFGKAADPMWAGGDVIRLGIAGSRLVHSIRQTLRCLSCGPCFGWERCGRTVPTAVSRAWKTWSPACTIR